MKYVSDDGHQIYVMCMKYYRVYIYQSVSAPEVIDTGNHLPAESESKPLLKYSV
jgi:hypothetical protein